MPRFSDARDSYLNLMRRDSSEGGAVPKVAPNQRISEPGGPVPQVPTFGYDLPSPGAIQQVQQWPQAPAPSPIDNGFGAGGGFDPGQSISGPIAPPQPPNFEQLADTEGTFLDQKGMYENKLRKYISDYESQVGNNTYGQNYDGDFLGRWSGGTGGGRMGSDFRNASTGLERNRVAGLTNTAEDFASRGMANSGLYADAFQKAVEGYGRQKQGLESATTNQIQDLSFKRGGFENDTNSQISAARREAVGRLMNKWNLTGGV